MIDGFEAISNSSDRVLNKDPINFVVLSCTCDYKSMVDRDIANVGTWDRYPLIAQICGIIISAIIFGFHTRRCFKMRNSFL